MLISFLPSLMRPSFLNAFRNLIAHVYLYNFFHSSDFLMINLDPTTAISSARTSAISRLKYKPFSAPYMVPFIHLFSSLSYSRSLIISFPSKGSLRLERSGLLISFNCPFSNPFKAIIFPKYFPLFSNISISSLLGRLYLPMIVSFP